MEKYNWVEKGKIKKFFPFLLYNKDGAEENNSQCRYVDVDVGVADRSSNIHNFLITLY